MQIFVERATNYSTFLLLLIKFLKIALSAWQKNVHCLLDPILPVQQGHTHHKSDFFFFFFENYFLYCNSTHLDLDFWFFGFVMIFKFGNKRR